MKKYGRIPAYAGTGLSVVPLSLHSRKATSGFHRGWARCAHIKQKAGRNTLRVRERSAPLQSLARVGAGILFLIVAAASCTRSVPAIDYCTLKVIWEQEEGGVLPAFSFFVIASDEDGPEDFSELRLYHDSEGLMWTLTSDDWTMLEDRGRTWVGGKMLRMPPGEALPKGQFRAVMVDKSGETSEKTFGFDTPAESPYRFPSLSVSEGDYTVTSGYPDNYLLMYFQDGAYRSQLKLSSLNGAIASLRLPSDVYSIALWADDESKAVSALTRKVYIRE
jgi:hypothetical protein